MGTIFLCPGTHTELKMMHTVIRGVGIERTGKRAAAAYGICIAIRDWLRAFRWFRTGLPIGQIVAVDLAIHLGVWLGLVVIVVVGVLLWFYKNGLCDGCGRHGYCSNLLPNPVKSVTAQFVCKYQLQVIEMDELSQEKKTARNLNDCF